MYLDHRTNPIDFENYKSKVKIAGPDFRILYHCVTKRKRSLAR